MKDSGDMLNFVSEAIDAKLKELFDLIRSQPGEYHNIISDGMIDWALTQFLPSSRFYGGLVAYSGIDDNDKNTVVIIGVANMDHMLMHLQITEETTDADVVA